MTYRLLLRRQAKHNLRISAKWYERQLAGLGREFVAEVEAVLDRLSENPLLYQPIYRDVRRALTRRFPYGIFYRVDQDDIVVFAIVPLHRDVTSWQDRL